MHISTQKEYNQIYFIFFEFDFIFYAFYKLAQIFGDLKETKNGNCAQRWAANQPNAAASRP
jgi:hypothetical protein